MTKIIEEFDAMSIRGLSIQFLEDGEQREGERMGCVGSLGGETTMRELTKRCEGAIVKKKVKPETLDLTLSAHVKVSVLREVFGLTNEDLKKGVYAYTTNSVGKSFVLTADVIDDFEDRTKLIAFPNCSSATGLKFNFSNGDDEVAEIELSLTALPEKSQEVGAKAFYYEAIVDELEDESIEKTWHSKFTKELVAIETP